MSRTKFPTLAVVLLVAGVVWGIDELGYLDFNFPWFPVILIIIALGMIVNRFAS